jgi:hypothetical protein
VLEDSPAPCDDLLGLTEAVLETARVNRDGGALVELGMAAAAAETAHRAAADGELLSDGTEQLAGCAAEQSQLALETAAQNVVEKYRSAAERVLEDDSMTYTDAAKVAVDVCLSCGESIGEDAPDEATVCRTCAWDLRTWDPTDEREEESDA